VISLLRRRLGFFQSVIVFNKPFFNTRIRLNRLLVVLVVEGLDSESYAMAITRSESLGPSIRVMGYKALVIDIRISAT